MNVHQLCEKARLTDFGVKGEEGVTAAAPGPASEAAGALGSALEPRTELLEQNGENISSSSSSSGGCITALDREKRKVTN